MKILVIILILLVFGLYFYTDATKEVISVSGNVVKESSKAAYQTAKPEIEKAKEDITRRLENG